MGMVAGMTLHTEQEHVPAHGASGTLEQREKKKREKASVPLPKIWGKAPSKGNTRIDAEPSPFLPHGGSNLQESARGLLEFPLRLPDEDVEERNLP